MTLCRPLPSRLLPPRRFSPRLGIAARSIPVLLALAGCGALPGVDCPPALAGHDVVYMLGRGWHTQIGLPADELGGGLAAFRGIFPGAHVVMFGYGKRTFMVAPPDDVSEYVIGPAPGPAVIEAVGLRASPAEAYGKAGLVTLALPPGGAARISAFLWNDLERDAAGNPVLVAPGHYPGSLFYGARSGYNLFHTCNTWVADALHAGGLPVDGDFVVLSGQTMGRAAAAATAQCRVATGGAGATAR